MPKAKNDSVQSEHNFTKRSGEGGPFLQAEAQEQAESCAAPGRELSPPNRGSQPPRAACPCGYGQARLCTALFVATSRAFLDWIWLRYPDSVVDVSQTLLKHTHGGGELSGLFQPLGEFSLTHQCRVGSSARQLTSAPLRKVTRCGYSKDLLDMSLLAPDQPRTEIALTILWLNARGPITPL